MIGGWYTNPEMRPFEQIARDNWESIKTIQWIEYSKLGDIDKLLSALLNTVDTNPELIRLHTRLLLRVRDWEMHGRTPDAMLRGVELGDYERWLSECEQSELRPKPTSEQRVYISESRRIVDKIRKERETKDLFEALKGRGSKKIRHCISRFEAPGVDRAYRPEREGTKVAA